MQGQTLYRLLERFYAASLLLLIGNELSRTCLCLCNPIQGICAALRITANYHDGAH